MLLSLGKISNKGLQKILYKVLLNIYFIIMKLLKIFYKNNMNEYTSICKHWSCKCKHLNDSLSVST